MAVKKAVGQIDTREFRQSFGTHVRRSEGRVIDTRAKSVDKMVLIDPSTFIEMMGDVPHDVAAIFSVAVSWRGSADVLKQLEEVRGRDATRRLLLDLITSKQLPLTYGKSDDATRTLFVGFLGSAKGCELYRLVALYLEWARRQSEFKQDLLDDESPEEASEEGAEPIKARVPARAAVPEGMLFDPQEADRDRDDPDGSDDEDDDDGDDEDEDDRPEEFGEEKGL